MLLRSSLRFALPLALVFAACTSDPAASDGGSETGDGDGDSGDGDGDTGDGDGEPNEGLTYWKDAKAILDARCVTCHVEGGIGPFALETWAQVEPFAPIIAPAIADLSMPPWPPNAECNSYEDDRSLTDAERELLLEWVANGYPEGDPDDAPEPAEPPEPFVADFTVQLPEPYTPTESPDDWRCFLIPWPEHLTEPVYVTGQIAYPDQQQILHHIITFVAEPGAIDEFIALDEADPGPGYQCFGGPGALDWSARWLGDWVPGIDAWRAPEGTGIRVAPGSMLIVQTHYNTLAGQPVADQTSLGFQVVDEVERPGTFVPVVNYQWVTGADPMTIPAGDPDVHHSVTLDRGHPLFNIMLAPLGVDSTEEVDVWRAALHMHMIGTNARIGVNQAGGDEDCLLQIDDWDFNWQGDYMLQEPTPFGVGDSMQLDCWYDNSQANQPIVNGQQKEPSTLSWGEGTLDEMCLGILYVARQ